MSYAGHSSILEQGQRCRDLSKFPMRLPNSTPYRLNGVTQLWDQNQCPSSQSAIRRYLFWIHKFAQYCQRYELDQCSELTQLGANKFARWWRSRKSDRHGRLLKRRHGQLQGSIKESRAALHAWSTALSMLGEQVPLWQPTKASPDMYASYQDFVDYLTAVRGNSEKTIRTRLADLTAFEIYRQSHGRGSAPISLSDIDDYITLCRRRLSRATVVIICSTIRMYLRFLHVTGKIDTNLAASVIAPSVRSAERPYRGLPWEHVQRILRAVDRRQPKGRRDYALLLMMSVYGFGVGEVTRLRLDDVDWRVCTIHVVRPKTGVKYLLPLLPAVARALSAYLLHGRPKQAIARELFLGTRVPFERLTKGTVWQILNDAAQHAGVTSSAIGTHVLRHTHATRELELGASVKIIGDILGHRNPESTSVYARVVSERLREVSLPVPT
jgi:integrase/recombinase XerD